MDIRVKMSLNNVKDSNLSLPSRQQLLNNMSSKESTSSNHQIRFTLRHLVPFPFNLFHSYRYVDRIVRCGRRGSTGS